MTSSKPLAPVAKPTKKTPKMEKPAPAATVSKASLVPVFVYGSLKRNFQLHKHYLEDQMFVGRGVIKGYTLVSLGPYPSMIHTLNTAHQVVGEFYLVSESAYHAMRSMEERAGYATVEVNGRYSDTNALPTDASPNFTAQAWVFPTDVGLSEWALINHQGVIYGYVDYISSDEKEPD